MRLKMPTFCFAICCGVAVFSGCTRSKRLITVIPEQDTAQEQLMYSVQNRFTSVPPVEPEARRLFFQKQIHIFEKVITRFPDDTIYTPEAILNIAEILYKMNEFETMIRYLRAAIVLYPHHPNFEPRSLYMIGLAYEQQEKYNDANLAYKECINKFENSKDETIQKIVLESRKLYNRPKTKVVSSNPAFSGN